MAIFVILSILGAILCYHSIHKSQINIRSKHLDHSSIKTCTINRWAAPLFFRFLGRPEKLLNAPPPPFRLNLHVVDIAKLISLRNTAKFHRESRIFAPKFCRVSRRKLIVLTFFCVFFFSWPVKFSAELAAKNHS